MMNRRTWIAGITATTLLAASLAACKQEQQGEETGQALPVMVVSSQPIELEETYSASIRGRQDVDIIPQVSGRIIRLCVKEGEQVATGQVLAVIDQTPYQAALRIAIANVSAARAKVETARIELNGKQSLFDEKVISDYELSVARNQLVVAQAELEQAKAQEANARNELSYTEIKSPSNGVIGTLPYRVGALVGPTIEQPFTVVSDNSEMYAYFSISENKLRQFEARYGSIDRIICEMPPISLQLNNGSVYGKQGKIETISGIVNPTTGAVQIKALFPNINRHLLSGTIGNVILHGVVRRTENRESGNRIGRRWSAWSAVQRPDLFDRPCAPTWGFDRGCHQAGGEEPAHLVGEGIRADHIGDPRHAISTVCPKSFFAVIR